jgi:hypothetical protein
MAADTPYRMRASSRAAFAYEKQGFNTDLAD